MRARAYVAVLAVLALAVVGAFLLSDQESPYADAAADQYGTDVNIDWSLSRGVLTLTKNTVADTPMPDYLGSDPDRAPWYAYSADIARVVVGDGITTIGNYAFANCIALSSVDIEGDVTKIGMRAFDSCYALSSISIPSTVTSIGNYAFYYCRSLSSLPIPVGVTEIGDYAFYVSGLISVSIPVGVTKIGNYTFGFCVALESVSIPVGVTSIGNYAFVNCPALSSVTIPAGVTSIGTYAFQWCGSIQEIVIPASVDTIGTYAFQDCRALRNIVIKDGSALATLGNRSFDLTNPGGSYASSVTAYVWSSSAVYDLLTLTPTVIGVDTSLVRMGVASDYDPRNPSLPGSYYGDESGANSGVHWDYNASTGTLEFTGTGEIAWATSTWNALRPYVQEVVISGDGGLTDSIKIGPYAFYECPALVSVTFTSKVTEIGPYAFYGCKLRGITIPDTVMSIGPYAFYDCRSLSSVVIPASVTSIGNSAFYRTYGLKTVEIQGATAIDAYAFHGSSLTSVAFSGNLKSIGERAFNQCYGLRSIVIPASVTSIGANAFRNCESLTSAAILAPGLALPATVFDGCTNLAAISIRYDGSVATHTEYVLVSTVSAKAIVIYFDGASASATFLVGDVRATQSLSAEAVTLSGFPAAGAARIGKTWIGVGDVQPGVGGYVLTVLDGGSFPVSKLGVARTVYASFGYYYVVSASISNGEIAPSGDVGVVGGAIRVAEHGDATFEFAANAGYAIKSVRIDGSKTSDEALAALATGTHTFSDVTGVHAISVETERLDFAVTASADANSTIAPAGSVGVARGGSVTFTFSASAGYAISDVIVDGASVPSAALAGTYAFSGVTSNHTISVTSAPSASSPGGAGSGSGSGSGSGNGGDGSDDAAGGSRTSGGVSVAWVLILIVIAIAVGSAVLWLVLGRRRRKD